MGQAGSGVGSTKLRWVELVTLQEAIKFRTVPPGQTGSMADVPVGNFQEPHEIFLLEAMLGVIQGRQGDRRIAERLHDQGGRNDGRGGEDHRLLDDVQEMSDIPWPGGLDEHFQRFGGKPRDVLLTFGSTALQKMGRQEGYVLTPGGEGRDLEGHDPQAVIEIFAEMPALHFRFEIAVRR